MKRKLSVGDTLNEVFSIYGAHAGVLLPVAFWLFLAVAILNGIAGSHVVFLPLVIIVSTIAGTLYQGMVVGLVRDVQAGKSDSSVSELFDYAMPVILPLIGAGLLAGIGIGIGLILVVVPGLFLLTIWALIAPAIVIEHQRVIDSFKRSRELVRGNGWPVFGAIVVAFLIAFVGSAIFAAIAAAIADGWALRIVFSALASTITAPIGALVAGVLYYRLLAIGGPAAVPGAAGPVDPPLAPSPQEMPSPPASPDPPPPLAPPAS
ncbi:MAG: hypothetical protein H0X42_13035 [Solirubrobacterales bacterium]|nr:hypothetical protein [Solirubrobacterales bacterium]